MPRYVFYFVRLCPSGADSIVSHKQAISHHCYWPHNEFATRLKANFRPTHKPYAQAFTQPRCSPNRRQCSRPQARVSPLTISGLTLLWLTRGRATELAHHLWEKDKCPAETIEIGAPVFITLVYRPNSHLLSPSAKCLLDLLFSSLHLKQFIKNEWEESKTLRPAREQ